MCTPFEWMMVAATTVQVSSQMQQAERLEQEGRERQELGNFQAQQAEADAVAEREAGEVRAGKIRKAAKSQQSEAKAALAAGGVEVTAGTPVRISQTIRQNAEEDALNEILYGDRKADRLEQDAALARQGGARARAGASSAAGSARMSAFGSAFSGGAEVARGWKTAAKRDKSGDYLLATGGETV